MFVSLKIGGIYTITINSRDDIDTVVISSKALVRRSKREFDLLERSSIPHGCIADVCRIGAEFVPWTEYGCASGMSILIKEKFAV